jgi:sterol regulatory element-binding transcription factor 1
MKDIKDEDDDMMGVNISRGMLDHSRMALCIFMLAVVTFNPFGVVLNRYSGASKDYSATVVEGRTLQQIDSKD